MFRAGQGFRQIDKFEGCKSAMSWPSIVPRKLVRIEENKFYIISSFDQVQYLLGKLWGIYRGCVRRGRSTRPAQSNL